ncbi:DUF4181 domain-containing protein [Cytobacillus praedii]|uniref:DUF4181 domain-containing protein n=1 Tax=Cytobacillus praedii TaxID=1742358 RepID=UPI002E21FC48|nr:DUF4181 domain-containing protein [Cytobacillus praedii]
MKFFVFLIVLIILAFLLEKVLNKLFGVQRIKLSETTAKNVDRWRRGIIVGICLCSFPFIINSIISIKWFWIVFLILSSGSESLLEWIYIKNSKQYITTLIFLILGLIIIYNVEHILSILSWN